MKILQVVGAKSSGKTYFIEKLLQKLKEKYKVATIKHSPTEDYIIDKEGKDSFRHIIAGSDMTVLVMKDKIFSFKKLKENLPLSELVEIIRKIEDFDFLIIEGYKEEKYPKVEVYRKKASENLISNPEELLAIITNDKISTSAKVFSFSEIKKIIKYLENNLEEEKQDVELKINGRKIPLNNFVKNIFKNTIKGMVFSLKGIEEIKKISLFINE